MTIFGWDQSHYDAPTLGTALAEGIVFITHKVGGDKYDPELASWWSGVRRLDPEKYLLGTYWIPRPDLESNPERAADTWIGILDEDCPGWRDREHILQMDAERWNGDDRTKPNRQYLQRLGNRLRELMPKLMPVCYASRGQYKDELAGLTFPLWNAAYPYEVSEGFKSAYQRAGGDNARHWAMYSGQIPALWQYTSHAVIGGQTTSDANAYRGTLTGLKALVAPGWSSDMDLTPQNLQDIQKAILGADIDPSTTNTYSLGGALWTLLQRSGVMVNTQLPALASSLAAVQSGLTVDTAALADDLAARLAPLLPSGKTDPASLAEAFRVLFTQTPPSS